MIDPTAVETTGYHLFFEPTGGMRQQLDMMIATLANTYNGPLFGAHVTLLARIEKQSEEVVIERAYALAALLPRFSARLEMIESEAAYFRALYYRVTPEPVSTYHKRAAEVFGMSESESFKPHLSLFYGLASQDKKVAMRTALPVLSAMECSFESLSVYRTPGAVATWEKIAEFPLAP